MLKTRGQYIIIIVRPKAERLYFFLNIITIIVITILQRVKNTGFNHSQPNTMIYFIHFLLIKTQQYNHLLHSTINMLMSRGKYSTLVLNILLLNIFLN